MSDVPQADPARGYGGDSHGLARPTHVDARTALGGDEPTHFTPWLARNVDVLGNVLGLQLSVLDDPGDDLLNGIHIEIQVGGYSLDILARDAAGRLVAIENQYGVADHRHLGQLLTYASGVGADVLVWVAERFTDAHLETIRWLNERTDDRCGVFAARARFMTIGSSPAAPVFELAAGPSEWARVSGARWSGPPTTGPSRRFSQPLTPTGRSRLNSSIASLRVSTPPLHARHCGSAHDLAEASTSTPMATGSHRRTCGRTVTEER